MIFYWFYKHLRALTPFVGDRPEGKLPFDAVPACDGFQQ